MHTILLLLAALQQQPVAQQPTGAQHQASRGAFDSSVSVLQDVGARVADLRSAYELYRRAVFNEPDGALVQRAAMYQTSCHALMESARSGYRKIAPSRLTALIRTQMSQYKDYLPSVARFAQRCDERMRQLAARGDERVAGAALRADVRAQGEQMVNGLRPYEARLHEVRVVMGWETRPVVPVPRP